MSIVDQPQRQEYTVCMCVSISYVWILSERELGLLCVCVCVCLNDSLSQVGNAKRKGKRKRASTRKLKHIVSLYAPLHCYMHF